MGGKPWDILSTFLALRKELWLQEWWDLVKDKIAYILIYQWFFQFLYFSTKKTKE